MISAIIVAGGKGVRMNAGVRKQYLLLAGRPILGHTLLAFDRCKEIDQIILVIPEDDFGFCRQTILPPLQLQKKVKLVGGGAERQESVCNGLAAIDVVSRDAADSLVLIHDAVRPFVRCELIRTCLSGAEKFGACIPGIPAMDTLKRVNSTDFIEKTVARDGIWLAQTPQAFKYGLIKRAHEDAVRRGVIGTDDASLVEDLGEKVAVISGSRLNIKITNPEDLLLADAIYRAESEA